jgi:pimeloyl-ACP methyl ester carboxylesterase
MARITISNIGIDYELLGEAGAPAVAITPGGRFSKESQGLRELGAALAAGGRRVLLWDRPNCGASDICFDADNESVMHAEVLTKLIRELDLGPTALAAGSAGSRVSLIAAARDPEIISHLVLWWISGGNIGLMQLAMFYTGESANACSRGGMEAVAAAPCWAEQIARNPRNRDIILRQNPDVFLETMQRWASFYVPSTTSPVPGVSPQDFARLKMPVLIMRSGKSDLSHTRRTSEWVHELIPHSSMIEPPWPDNEWNMRTAEAAETMGVGLFKNWPAVAPYVVDFTAR